MDETLTHQDTWFSETSVQNSSITKSHVAFPTVPTAGITHKNSSGLMGSTGIVTERLSI